MSSHFHFILFLLIISVSIVDSKRIRGKYPAAILLPSGNYFIVSDKGINVYNPNFSLNASLYNFTGIEVINNNTNFDHYKQTLITEYSLEDNFFVFCLVKGLFLYVFENNMLLFLNLPGMFFISFSHFAFFLIHFAS